MDETALTLGLESVLRLGDQVIIDGVTVVIVGVSRNTIRTRPVTDAD